MRTESAAFESEYSDNRPSKKSSNKKKSKKAEAEDIDPVEAVEALKAKFKKKLKIGACAVFLITLLIFMIINSRIEGP
jgi:hypothetical protein